MYKFLDKSILFLISCCLFIFLIIDQNLILYIILPISFSCFIEYFYKKNFVLVFLILYSILTLLFPYFLFMFPLIFYDYIFNKVINKYLPYLILIILTISNVDIFNFKSIILFIFIFILLHILKFKTINYNNLLLKYKETRDELTENSNLLKQNLTIILQKQDSEINNSIFEERTRIAREIHDNVGHMLSSAILQLGAIIYVSKENEIKNNLNDLKLTLSDCMDSIRNSVHNLRDEPIDLYTSLKKIIDDFKFCKINLKYEFDISLSSKINIALIAILKESLSNIIKHSNATEVNVSLIEHPKIIQFIIHDNGKVNPKNIYNNSGMGLENITQRVESFNGLLKIYTEKGFKIFISFKKEV